MNIGIVKEQTKRERRVAVVPMHVKQMVKANHTVLVEQGAGLKAGFLDAAYESAGAKVIDRETLYDQAEIVLSVRFANASSDGEAIAKKLKKGQTVIGLMEPYEPHPSFDVMRKNQVSAFALELVPRTTRAQSMDVLSSMANLAGYKAALIGANLSPKLFPMMMTAAGTITPAKVFVIGVGVAGLQAIATAKRLGAVVSAYDVRPEVKEQVESLGASFVEYDLESGAGEGGYAKKMDDDFYKRQQALMAKTLADHDVIITTANIPGKKAPVLITEAMMTSMKQGSVIVDLAAERGGNCALSKPGETVDVHGVLISGVIDIASGLAGSTSTLYSKNIMTFVNHLLEGKTESYDMNDDIVRATAVVHENALHDNVRGKEGVE